IKYCSSKYTRSKLR
ncbi:hypothetical protein, partial [Staphylococcus aureus]